MDPRVARRTDRYAQFAVAAADQAAAEAELAACDPDRVAVVIGTGVGGLITLQENCESFLARGERGVSPNFVPMMMPNAAAGAVAIRLGMHGPGFSVASACATGAHAIGEGDADDRARRRRRRRRRRHRGRADARSASPPSGAWARSRPTGVSRPFDARRDGFVMGEGAAVLILEREEHARARGATVLGRIVGYGASNDAFDMVQPDEDGAGALIGDARRARRTPAPRRPTSASSPPTAPARRSTTASSRSRSATLFGADAPPISSTKSAIGHLLGAAGSTEALVCVEALRRGLLPPTINYEEPDPDCDLDYLAEGAREAPGVELALSNSFGFGGQNACLAFAAA